MDDYKIQVVESGIPQLDEVVEGIRLGDNVVWQVDDLDDYSRFAVPFARQAIDDRRKLVYLRFASHPPILRPRQGLTMIEVDPAPGFDYFSGQVNTIIEEQGLRVFYVFDNLSTLVVDWATDEMLANFFQVTCPLLFELYTVAYFALTRGKHSHSAVARIRDTTQLLIDCYRAKGDLYIHPIKVWDRYSSEMFLPHEITDSSWQPLVESGDASAVLSTASRRPLRADEESIAPWESVYRRLSQYRESGQAVSEEAPEVNALKQELARMMIGSHPEFNLLVDRYLSLSDLFDIRSRLIGSGRIGGKAAGMLVARRILLQDEGDHDFNSILDEHDSFYIGSDVFFTFLVNNDLFRLRLRMSRNSQISWAEFEEVELRFLEGSFPPDVMSQLREMLDYFGQSPIIVRSSSLLEDSFGNAFAGKYRSEFCANQGDPDERLEAFLRAVKLVYASALNPAALSYRRRRGLGESDEQMAILVQRVAGKRFGRFFFPMLAGVAFSKNLYAWTDRIDPEQGMVRLVFGLGTRAVDRVGRDYPRMIAVSNPRLRPEVGARVATYSQREVDLLDLQDDEFATRGFDGVLQNPDYPNLYLLVSVMKEGHPYDPYGNRVEGIPRDFVLTFNNLIARTDFVGIMADMLRKLESAYGYPVDTEFTASVDAKRNVRVNLLQCRPLWLPGTVGTVTVPKDVPAERVLFKAGRIISGGVIEGIRHVIYVHPRAYAESPAEVKSVIGRLVGRVNEHPDVEERKLIMMGPGRWGSSNIDLGVNVTYADIDKTAVLVEIAGEKPGQLPEVSYGTHFFQDLVEADIIYVPVFPEEEDAEFNAAFFEGAHSVLPELLPDAAAHGDIVRVVDVVRESGGRTAKVVADPEKQEAICFLE